MTVRIAKDCPMCGSFLRLRTGKHGDFMSCNGYPRCKFSEPIAEIEQAMVNMRNEYDYYRDLIELVRATEKSPDCTSCLRTGFIVNGSWLVRRM